MPDLSPAPYSYRDDPSVPSFDDSRALFLFDGICVLCSGGASWLMRHDRKGLVNFSPAQDALGRAIYAHTGIELDESYLLIKDGRIYSATAGYLELCRTLGGIWHLARITRLCPERLRDAIYALVARNRYRWFGKVDYCALLTPEQRRRLL